VISELQRIQPYMLYLNKNLVKYLVLVGLARLQKMIGITRTKDIVMRSRRISGQQAYDWGVATMVVKDEELSQSVDSLVEELLAFSPIAQRTAKKLLN
jgi:2-oxoglutaroyl-CoA hydrolase